MPEQLAGPDCSQTCAHVTLQCPIHGRGASDQMLNLLLPLRPLPFHGTALAVELSLHGFEGLDDSLYALAKVGTGEVLAQQLRLFALYRGGGTNVGNGEHRTGLQA